MEKEIKTKFNGQNWRKYKSEAKKYFMSLKSDYSFEVPYWEIVTGVINIDQRANPDMVWLWSKIQARLALALVQSMTEKEANRFCNYENGSEIWSKLESDYGVQQQDLAARQMKISQVRTDYYKKTFDPKTENIKEHLDQLEIYKDELMAVGEDQVTEQAFIERVLSSLPNDDFKDIVTQIRFTGDPLNRTSYTHLRSTLQAAIGGKKSKDDKKKEIIKEKESNDKKDLKADLTNTSLKCLFCGKTGHLIDTCIAMANSRSKYQQFLQQKSNYNNNNNQSRSRNRNNQNFQAPILPKNLPFYPNQNKNRNPQNFQGKHFNSQQFQNNNRNPQAFNQNNFNQQNPFIPPRSNATMVENHNNEMGNYGKNYSNNYGNSFNGNDYNGEYNPNLNCNNTLYYSFSTNFSPSGNQNNNGQNNPNNSNNSRAVDDNRIVTRRDARRITTGTAPQYPPFEQNTRIHETDTVSLSGSSYDLIPQQNIVRQAPIGNNLPLGNVNIPFTPAYGTSPFTGNIFGAPPRGVGATPRARHPFINTTRNISQQPINTNTSSISSTSSERPKRRLEDENDELKEIYQEMSSKIDLLVRNNNTMNVRI